MLLQIRQAEKLMTISFYELKTSSDQIIQLKYSEFQSFTPYFNSIAQTFDNIAIKTEIPFNVILEGISD